MRIQSIVVVLVASVALSCEMETQTSTRDPSAYSVSETPVWKLEDDGSNDRMFVNIAARRLSNGDVIVGDRGNGRLVVFGRSQQLLREIAHKGSGPGEIGGAFEFTSIGDSVFVFDTQPMSLGDVRIYRTNGGFVSKISAKSAGLSERATILDKLGRDQWLVQSGGRARPIHNAPAVGDFVADSQTLGLLLVARDGRPTAVRWLPPFVRSWMLTVAVPSLQVPGLPTDFPFRGRTMFVVAESRVWIVDGATGRFTAYDTNGLPVVTDSLRTPRLPFNRRDLENARTVALAAARNETQRSLLLGIHDPRILPAVMPMVSDALAGDNGSVWLQVYRIDGGKTQQFVHLSPKGEVIGTLALDRDIHVQQFGKDFVMGVKTSADGSESIVEYSFKR